LHHVYCWRWLGLAGNPRRSRYQKSQVRRAKVARKQCLRREIKEELPKLKLGRLKLWKEVKKKNRRTAANLRALATAFRSQADILKRKDLKSKQKKGLT
jgi:hypothetical protein